MLGLEPEKPLFPLQPKTEKTDAPPIRPTDPTDSFLINSLRDGIFASRPLYIMPLLPGQIQKKKAKKGDGSIFFWELEQGYKGKK
jgi:hypothetical protein